MSGIYIASFSFSGGTDADQNIFQLTAGSADKVELLGFEIYSDVVAPTNLHLELARYTTAGTGGTAETEREVDEGNTTTNTANLVSGRTAPGTIGDLLRQYEWEQMGPLVYAPIPKQIIKIQESGILALNLQTDPESAQFSGWVAWEEL